MRCPGCSDGLRWLPDPIDLGLLQSENPCSICGGTQKINAWVCGLAFGYGDDPLVPSKVLLMDKAHGPPRLRGHWNGLGGSVEDDEAVVAAMVREFGEESAAETLPENWELFALIQRVDGWIFFFRHFEKHLSGLQTGGHSPTDEVIRWHSIYPRFGCRWMPNLHWLVPLALDPGLCRKHAHYPIQFPVIIRDLRPRKEA